MREEKTRLTSLDRFKLWTDYAPMSLLITNYARDAGLTSENLKATVKSRLGAADLYSSSASNYLYIYVDASGAKFRVSLEFHKRLHDRASGENGFAIT